MKEIINEFVKELLKKSVRVNCDYCEGRTRIEEAVSMHSIEQTRKEFLEAHKEE